MTGIDLGWKHWRAAVFARARGWWFPVALLAVGLGLSAFGISGSSVGMYLQVVNGAERHDPNLLYGRPESIRSDEWLVNTAMTVAQARAGFPRVNPNVGRGEDVSVILDVPYRDWSTLFRPENWGFFVWPLEVAFALKWWLMGIGAVIALYALILEFLPRRYGLAALLALSFVWSPFMQWWYQPITLLPVMYGATGAVVAMRLRRMELGVWARLGWSLLLAYVLAAFCLVLYPPFQILVAAVMTVLVGGWLIERGGLRWRQWGELSWSIGGAVAVAGVIVAAFLATRAEVVHAVTHTVYPGERVVASGGFGWDRLLSGFVSFRLQLKYAMQHFYTNASEGSSFIFVWPFLVIPAIWSGVRRWRRKHGIDWGLLGLHVLLAVLLAHLFLPLPPNVTRLLGMSGILQSRVLLGIGLIGLFQLVLVIRAGTEQRYPRWMAAAMAAGAVIVQVWAGLTLMRHNPGYVSHPWEMVVMAAAVGLVVGLVLWGRVMAGVVLALVLNGFSIFYIHPLYHGLAALTNTPLTAAIQQQEARRPGPWIIVDNPSYATYAVAAGAPSYSGVYTYPQLGLWHGIDDSAAAHEAYDRYALAMFVTEVLPEPIILKSGDTFAVAYAPCDRRFGAIKHVVAMRVLASDCLVLDQTIAYDRITFYLYHTR